MDDDKRYIDRAGVKRQLEEMAVEISSSPFGWVLILGDGISSHRQDHMIGELTKEAISDKRYLDKAKLVKAVRDQDYQAMKDSLFGGIWDGGSFLDARREEQSELRKEYARQLAKKEEINTECADICLELAFRIFPGIIMTTCQDETAEAFLENECSMVTDGLICTPYTLMTSDRWKKWRDAIGREDEESASHIVSGVQNSSSRIIIKLYGNCDKPNRMLLSREDFDIYYPEDGDRDGGESGLTGFLSRIFSVKNLFFLGAGSQTPFPPGILKCLKETKNKKKRYALITSSSDIDQMGPLCWKDYGITPVSDHDIRLEDLYKKGWRVSEQAGALFADTHIHGEKDHEDVSLDVLPENGENGIAAMNELFWKLYIRRPYAQVSQREMYILENNILGYKKNGIPLKWNGSHIYILAMIANNLEDFYDLKKAMDRAGDTSLLPSDNYCGELLWSMMNERLDHRCRELYGMLAFYGSDFPVDFLRLIEKDESGERNRPMDLELDGPAWLKQWKRAGIQLANSGICVQQGNSRDIYRRIELADSIMETAGSELESSKLEKMKREAAHILSSSYFHLSTVVSSEIKNKTEYDSNKMKSVFAQMFKNLSTVLTENSTGYNELLSLLFTEAPVIMEKICDMEDNELEWKPELIYRLFQACPIQIKPHWDKIDTMMMKMQTELDTRAAGELPGLDGRWRSKAAMLHQTRSIIYSQSYKPMDQLKGLEECNTVDALLETYGKAADMPEDIFRQLIQTYIQRANIFGRLGTIVEIGRSRERQGCCAQQEEYLDSMKKHLHNAAELIKSRKGAMNMPYIELEARASWMWGKYYFKKSQLLSENRRFGEKECLEEEKDSYEKGEKAYLTALALYSKYSGRYEIQRADVLRSLGDLYCRKAKDARRRPEDYHDNEVDSNCLMKKCRETLTDAYILYRRNHALRGIADVLLSRGNTEDYSAKPQDGRRSLLAFYNVSKAIYNYVGDQWSRHVAIQFYINAVEGRMNKCSEADRERLELKKEFLIQEQSQCDV